MVRSVPKRLFGVSTHLFHGQRLAREHLLEIAAHGFDTVEVFATLLFLPIFLAFVYRGVVGGLVAAVAATAVYTLLRYPAIDAIGLGEYSGLIVSRAAARFGAWRRAAPAR